MKTILLFLIVLLTSCQTAIKGPSTLKVDAKKQKAQLISGNRIIKEYSVSTGRGGIGNKPSSNQTPTGKFEIVKEIGEGMPLTTGFKGGVPTKNANGKDPIISRVLFINGLEPHNANSMSRYIRIHGTPYVEQIGKPVSLGCVRFTPWDIASLCQFIKVGDLVEIH